MSKQKYAVGETLYIPDVYSCEVNKYVIENYDAKENYYKIKPAFNAKERLVPTGFFGNSDNTYKTLVGAQRKLEKETAETIIKMVNEIAGYQQMFYRRHQHLMNFLNSNKLFTDTALEKDVFQFINAPCEADLCQLAKEAEESIKRTVSAAFHKTPKTSSYKYTLLTNKEYFEHKLIIPLVNEPWWLRSPGYDSYYACAVDDNGFLYNNRTVRYTRGIRPALLITNPDRTYEYGSEIKIGKYSWTVLHSDEHECYALCTEIVATRRFDKKSNEYDTSEVKQWLENKFPTINNV